MPVQSIVKIGVLPDGNCAFNAFALGICDLIESNQSCDVQALEDALQKSRHTIKEWLSNNKNLETRQKFLSEVLRKLAVNYIRKNYDSFYKKNYEEILYTTYSSYIGEVDGSIWQGDDIFCVNPKIKAKFDELKQQNSSKKLLLKWWEDFKEEYFSYMGSETSNAGDRRSWGGAQEIFALAKIFKINVSLRKNANVHDDGILDGCVDNLFPDQVVLLRRLDLGHILNDGSFILNVDRKSDQLKEKVTPLQEPLQTRVVELLNQLSPNEYHWSQIESIIKHSLTVEEARELKVSLSLRGVVYKNEKGDDIFINNNGILDKERTMLKIRGINDQLLRDKVVKAFKQQEVSFSIELANQHFSYLRRVTSKTTRLDGYNPDDFKSGFNIPCGQNYPTSIVEENEYFSMRDWQKEAFELLATANHMILNAPMGSGKSWMMCLLSIHKMREKPSLKCIIAVPQTMIASNFMQAKLHLPTGENVDWSPENNFCAEDASKKRYISQQVRNWLSSKQVTLNERVIICTHMTLAKVYKQLEEENSLDLFEDTLLWVDEAHHVKNSESQDDPDYTESNEIGRIVKNFLQVNNSQVGLVTASFFRGDKCGLLTESMEEDFTRYNLAYDKYLQSMRYLKSFSFDFFICGANYQDSISTLVEQAPHAKDIIYIPHRQSCHATKDKYKEVENIIAAYKKTHGDVTRDFNFLIELENQKGGRFKILNLVDERNRKEKKKFMDKTDFKDENGKDALDLIISLGMFKEGADWVWANRSIIIGARNSLVEVVQMLGRLLRDAPSKSNVQVIQVLPFSLKEGDENFLENLNNYLKAIFASLILEDIFKPVKIKDPKGKEEIAEKGPSTQLSGVGSNINRTALAELIPDEAVRLSVVEDAFQELVNIRALGEVNNSEDSLDENTEKGEEDKEKQYNQYQEKLPGILDKYGIHSNPKEIGDHILRLFMRRSLKIQGIDVEEIDINLIAGQSYLQGLLYYTSTCGLDTFNKLRRAISATYEERWNSQYEYLRQFRKENPSRWPSRTELYPKGSSNNLGDWCKNQRSKSKQNILTKEKSEKLEAICFPFEDQKDKMDREAWNKQYEYLCKFREENPEDWPVQMEEYPKGSNNNLGSWLSTQKKRRKDKQLKPERYEKLKSLGFPFEQDKKEQEEKKWTDMFEQLKRFKETNGYLPRNNASNSSALEKWYAKQRIMAREGELPHHRHEKLTSLGCEEATLREIRWVENFELLKEFRKEYPDRWPRQTERYRGKNLGTWVANLKNRKETMNLEQEKLLQEIEFPRGTQQEENNAAWHKNFECLQQYYEQKGDWPTYNVEFPIGNPLGVWFSSQKTLNRNGKLKQSRKEDFERIKCDLSENYRDRWWGENLALLKKYITTHNKLPKQNEKYEGENLGAWFSNKKRDWGKGKLTAEHTEQLREIGVDLNSRNDEAEAFATNAPMKKKHRME